MSDRIQNPLLMQDVDILDRLVEDYNQGRVSALLGAGLSLNVSDSYCTWGNLLKDAYCDVFQDELEQYCDDYISHNVRCGRTRDEIKNSYVAEQIKKQDLLQLVSMYINKYGSHEAIDTYIEFRTPYAVKETDAIKLKYLNGKEEIVKDSAFKVHRQLLSCAKFKNIFTTNYDNLLEFTAANFKKGDKAFNYESLPVYKSSYLSNRLNEQNIIKIHGNLRQSEDESFGFDGDNHLQYIVAQEDYESYKQKHEVFSYLMRLYMLLGKFCLVGFSGSDPNYKGWLNWMKDILDKEADDGFKVYIINVHKDYKKHYEEEWAYTERMFNRNHRIAVIHLYDEKILKRIVPKGNADAGKDSADEMSPSEDVVLTYLFKYIAEQENNGTVNNSKTMPQNPSDTGKPNLDLGKDYYTGNGVDKDYEFAFKYLKAAESEDEAKALLAECYLYGRGTEIDLSEAVRCCQDDVPVSSSVLYDIGECYYYGKKGVEENKEEAVKWYTKSAKQGNSSAQNDLGYCYQHGIGVKKNADEAVKWYTKSAEQGNSSGQNNLGYCYQHGIGVKKNADEAVKWYTKSAKQGNSSAQNNLGLCYQEGIGVEKNLEEAVEWYTKSAEQGNSYGQCNLGCCYQEGIGVKKNADEAVKWYKKAAEQGDDDAKKRLKELGVE